jgi:hypothetical protein
LRPSHVFYLRHSSNWNPHRLHSEPFPPKENHNVGLLRFDDDHDHICYRFAQVQIFGGKSNVFKSLQYHTSRNCFASIPTCNTRLSTRSANCTHARKRAVSGLVIQHTNNYYFTYWRPKILAVTILTFP